MLDPACGDGRFLFEAARVIRSGGGVPVLTGADIDLGGLADPTSVETIEVIRTDSLRHDWGGRHFDIVVGNPPFLSQLQSATVRPGGSVFGGGPYADAAADFLALAVHLARPDGGRVGLVLPMSLLTARDAGPIRAAVTRLGSLCWFWWSPDALFDAMVRTCAVGIERTEGLERQNAAVERATGIEFEPCPPVAADRSGIGAGTDNDHWGWLIADALGIPGLPPLRTDGTMSARALVTANFRDQYYGMIGAVSDAAEGHPLITTGLIDVARCHWGTRPTRFAKQRFLAPRLNRAGLVPFMQRWADRCLVPKVLVATQTRVLEAVADPVGEWLPAVPVIRLVPDRTDADAVWRVAAVLTSPVASALIDEQSVGSGLSVSTVRVSQRTLGGLAWPAGDVDLGVEALRGGDIAACGRLVDAAYGVEDPALMSWWWAAVSLLKKNDER